MHRIHKKDKAESHAPPLNGMQTSRNKKHVLTSERQLIQYVCSFRVAGKKNMRTHNKYASVLCAAPNPFHEMGRGQRKPPVL
jgi:hypothetical protein